MGFRVGEVKQDSAIIWTRITKYSERNWEGYREPTKRQPYVDEYVPSKIKVADRQGEVVGAPGQVRVRYAPSAGGVLTYSDWVAVTADQDFVHQFRLDRLESGTRYSVYVETRDSANGPVSAATGGSFKTPARPDTWQDVSFTVVTGQSYWDLDHKDGYHIYPAMQRLKPHFIVPTGDTVYLDSEAPRARTVALARYHWHRMYIPCPAISNFTATCLATGKWTTMIPGPMTDGLQYMPPG